MVKLFIYLAQCLGYSAQQMTTIISINPRFLCSMLLIVISPVLWGFQGIFIFVFSLESHSGRLAEEILLAHFTDE